MASHDVPDKVKKFLEKRKEQNIARFKNNSKVIKQSFLIICEGENTEPDYFNEFKLGSARVEAVGKGMNTISLVRQAVQLKKEYLKRDMKFDQYWVVFDKDDWTEVDFNNAIAIARASDFKVAYSNQAFEYWFMLHFNLHQGKIDRNTYEAKLTDYLGFKYAKDSSVSSKIFNILLKRQETVISNARHAYNSFGGTHASPATEESSTTVFLLVEELRKYL
jgi:hypothetical protein